MHKITSFILAAGVTLVLIGMSAIAGWQRGGNVAEQWLWMGAACFLTASVHLLPAIVGKHTVITKVIWSLAFTVCVFGHSQFFTFSEIHAGESRMAKVEQITVGNELVRSPVMIARDISKASSTAIKLQGDKKEAQFKLISALEQELRIAQNVVATNEQAAARIVGDPVGYRIGSVFNVSSETVMLVVGLMTAIILEMLAVILWNRAFSLSTSELALASRIDKSTTKSPSLTSANKNKQQQMDLVGFPQVAALVDVDMEAVMKEVMEGRLEPKVTPIRKYLRCSQGRAIEIRRKVVTSVAVAA